MTMPTDVELIRNLRARTDAQADTITNLLRKIERLEKEIEALNLEYMDELNRGQSYGGTD